jgi:hypothetical protein
MTWPTFARILATGLAFSFAAAGYTRADVLSIGQHSGSPVGLTFLFNSTKYTGVYGGNFSSSTLNGQSLPFVYCVDLYHTIALHTTYNPTGVTQDGTLFTRTDDNTPTVSYGATTGGRVVSLLQAYAYNSPDEDHQAALQASIWSVLYGSSFSLIGTSRDWASVQSIYNSIVASYAYNHAAPLTNSYWLSPYTSGSGGTYVPHQGEVTLTVASPEPASVTTLGVGLCSVGLVAWMRRRKRSN